MRALIPQERISAYVPGFGSMTIPICVLFWTGSISFPALLINTAMDIDNHVATWKVIALVSGNIEAVSAAAQDRPGPHEWTVWGGPAADKAELHAC
jgi:hypothetical protein